MRVKILTRIKYFLPISRCNYLIQLDINKGKLFAVSFQAIKEQAGLQAMDDMNITDRQPIIYEDKKIISQFRQYLDNPLITWTVSFVWPEISAFQRSVLDYINNIPLGTTKTYGQVARDLHTSARAVGNACRRNPFPIIIPCHRVVAQNGLGGYDGDISDIWSFTPYSNYARKNNPKSAIKGRLAIKYFLLQHEQACINI